MKRNIFNDSILLIILCVIFHLSCGEPGDWVAKVEGEYITLEELNSSYYAQHKQLLNLTQEEIDKYASEEEYVQKLPTLNKQLFLDELIKQKLVYKKAVDDGALKNKEIQALIQMARDSVVVQFYLKDKFKNEIEVPEKEVEKVYSQQKNKMFQGVTIEQAEKRIKQELQARLLNKKIVDFAENLKETSKVEKNKEYKNMLQKKADVKKDEKTTPSSEVNNSVSREIDRKSGAKQEKPADKSK